MGHRRSAVVFCDSGVNMGHRRSAVVLALALATHITPGDSEGSFSRDARTVAGTPPEGCTRWSDKCNTCFIDEGVIVGCTTDPCDDPGDSQCQLMVDGRQCVVGTDCSKPQTCALAKQSSAEHGGMGHFDPRCNPATGEFMPVQCSGSTGECWCVYTDTGDTIERAIAGETYTFEMLEPSTCIAAVAVDKGGACLMGSSDLLNDNYECEAGYLSAKCPRCRAGLQCRRAPTDGQAHGVCMVIAASLLDPEGQATLEQIMGDYDHGQNAFEEMIIKTCSSHNLELVCNAHGQSAYAPEDGAASFCASTCLGWCRLFLQDCEGKRPAPSADVLSQIRAMVKLCPASEL